MPTFRVKLGANDLNCVDAPLNPTYSLTYSLTIRQVAALVLMEVCDLTSSCCYYFLLFKQVSDGRSFNVTVRFDTDVELLYYRHGGILNYMILQML